jgi:hypothetical protein
MSELLLRGWNVAVPVVDVGDDIFVIDDNDKTTWRLQVKTATTSKMPKEPTKKLATFGLSRAQLKEPQAVELFYFFVVRDGAAWRFLILPRDELQLIRDRFEKAGGSGKGPKPKPDGGDALSLKITLDGKRAVAWGSSLDPYLGRWPDGIYEIKKGPGAVKTAEVPVP